MQKKNKGFTLIEMLVVVLIIGILAGVALPQYRNSVIKANFAEVFTNLSALGKAAEVCKLHKGEPCDMSELDIEIGEEMDGNFVDQDGNSAQYETDKFIYYSPNVSYALSGSIVNALYKKEDVCICLTDDGFKLDYSSACGNPDPSVNYEKILNIPEGGCACC